MDLDMKEPKAYIEQLAILRKRGCLIENESKAIQVLMRIGYYRFSGYLLAYKRRDGDFAESFTFERVLSIYDFDKGLRSIVSMAVSEAEVNAKSLIAYQHGHQYGATGYMDSANYNMTKLVQKHARHVDIAHSGFVHDWEKLLSW